MPTIHGISEGDTVEVTAVSGTHKAIDQSSDEWTGNLELGRDEIAPNVREGVRFEVRSINHRRRGNKYTLTLFPLDGQDVKSTPALAGTYPSWPGDVSAGMHFDADPHHTKYSSKYFDLEVV